MRLVLLSSDPCGEEADPGDPIEFTLWADDPFVCWGGDVSIPFMMILYSMFSVLIKLTDLKPEWPTKKVTRKDGVK